MLVVILSQINPVRTLILNFFVVDLYYLSLAYASVLQTGFSPRIRTVFCIFLIPLICATRTAHLVCRNFFTLMIFDEEYKL
jgi:hypothetical protein